MLTVSLDCLFLIAPSVFSNVYVVCDQIIITFTIQAMLTWILIYVKFVNT
jgi:hypothetical protein